MPSPAPSPCAPDAAVAALARGDLDGAGPWVGHIDACPACRAKFDALVDAAPAAGLGDDLARLFGGAEAEAARLLRPPAGPGELGRLGPYRVLGVLGAGGMGLVLRAEETALGRHVALKVMRGHLAADPAAIARFQREARAMAAVEHDHVVPIYRVDSDNGVPFVAMPLLAGETLAAAARREGRLPPGRVIELGRQIAAGLAAAHARGLIHRDVKPANIWLEPRPDGAERVRLLDFGLARAAAGSDVSRSGAVVGTPAYMSPEQARGRPADHRSDLFSLGVVLYRLATGTAPFDGEDHFAVARQVVDADPPAPAAAPPGLSALIMRLLAKDPAGRPATAQAVADELARLAAGGPTPARPAVRRRAWAGAVAVALGIAAIVLWFRAPAADDGPPAPAASHLELAAEVVGDRRHAKMYALSVAAAGSGPVVLTEGFPDGKGAGLHAWTADLAPVGALPSAGDYIRAVAATPDGRRFVTVGGGGLEVWELAGASARRVIAPAAPPAPIGGIVVDPAGRRVYTTDYADGGRVRAYALTADALTPLGPLPGALGVPWKLAVSADGRWVGATAKVGRVCLWDTHAAGGPAAHVLRAAGPGHPVVAFAPDNRRAWVTQEAGAGDAYDLAAAGPARLAAGPPAAAAGVVVAAFAGPAGRLIVVGEGRVVLIDMGVEPPRVVGARAARSPTRAAAYAGGRLYTGHDDGVRAWAVPGP